MNLLSAWCYGLRCLDKVRDYVKDSEGQTLVEYALILVLIAVVVLVMLRGIGTNVNSVFSTVNSNLANPNP